MFRIGGDSHINSKIQIKPKTFRRPSLSTKFKVVYGWIICSLPKKQLLGYVTFYSVI